MTLRASLLALTISGLTATLVACNDGGDGGNSTADAGGGSAGSGTMGAGQGGSDGGVPDASAAADGGNVMRVPLPEGSREYDRVFSLVDADAAQQLKDYLEHPEGMGGSEATLALIAQKFYAVYPDDYDFLFVLTDRTIETGVSAAYDAVRQETMVGTGVIKEDPKLQYYSAARLKGVIGANYVQNAFGPLLHELAHRWGNFLDPSLGFGKDGDLELGAHWGLTSVFGQLGGFDAASIECETPAGAKPPNCTALPSGRTRYTFSEYGPNTNSFQSVPFAPLELYLMGLIPKEEVPETFMVLLEGETDLTTWEDRDGRMTAEAAGIGEIAFADVVALHGERTLATEAERHFTAAFIVVSDKPLADEFLADAARWAALLAGEAVPQDHTSFAAATGNRATIDTKLGLRRSVDDPLVPPSIPDGVLSNKCSLANQDCEAGYACYHTDRTSCWTAGLGVDGASCLDVYDCNVGFGCLDNVCRAYCEPEPGIARSCDRVCPGTFELIVGATADEVGGAYCTM